MTLGGGLSWITSLVYSVRCGWRGLPWITKTFLSLEMFQKCRSYFLWGRHKGLTSFWARPKFLLHRRYQHGMRYWHYLRENFECSLIYFSKWISHTPQHLNIISNKFLTSCYPTYQRDTAMKWELLLRSLRTPYALSPLHWCSHCHLFIESTFQRYMLYKTNSYSSIYSALPHVGPSCLMW